MVTVASEDITAAFVDIMATSVKVQSYLKKHICTKSRETTIESKPQYVHTYVVYYYVCRKKVLRFVEYVKFQKMVI